MAKNKSYTSSLSQQITLFAQPYDVAATGFYFHGFEEYQTKASTLRNDYGEEVEEFVIPFIVGDGLDCDLFKALEVHQGELEAYFTACESWDDYQKIIVIIAVGECNYSFDLENDSSDDFDIELYELDSIQELAEQFIEDGLYGVIPNAIRFYLDIDAITRELSMDYSEINLNGINYIYRCS
jgi:hypothetical protein